MKNPHAGLYATFTTEFAGLGGDAEFLKLTGRGTYYHTLSEEINLVGLLSAGAGHIRSNRRQRPARVRLCSRTTIASSVASSTTASDLRLRFPMAATTTSAAHLLQRVGRSAVPGSGCSRELWPEEALYSQTPQRSMATIFAIRTNGALSADTSRDSAWRASVGAGLIWASPFGPLRVDYAVPVMKEDSDEEQNFNFGISTRF